MILDASPFNLAPAKNDGCPIFPRSVRKGGRRESRRAHESVKIKAVKQRFLSEFFEQIAPFRYVWRSARLVGYAGLIEGAWVLFGGRVVFSPERIDAQVLRKLVDFEDFFAFVDEIPSSEVDLVLREIVETENLQMKLGGSKLRTIQLKAGGNNSLSWFQPARFDRAASSLCGSDCVGFQWTIHNSLQIAQVGAMDLLKRTSELLRLKSNVDGVEALAKKHTPGMPLDHFRCPQLQIVAPLPFTLRYTHGEGVFLGIPETVDPLRLRLKAFFGPSAPALDHLVGQDAYPLADGTSTFTWDFEWPQNARYADIRLFCGDREIDNVTINRWASSATVRGAVDEYFDVQHTQLQKALTWQDRSKSDVFELAVVRLMNLLGIPAIWYGKSADPDRPDAAALTAAENSRSLVLLIECTREKPSEKFGALAERTRQLSLSIRDEAVVSGVVFTPARVTGTDLAAASEYGIWLVGADELTHLLGLLTTREATAHSVFQYFAQRTAAAAAERLTRPW